MSNPFDPVPDPDSPSKGSFDIDEYKARIARALVAGAMRAPKPYEKRTSLEDALLGRSGPTRRKPENWTEATKRWAAERGLSLKRVDRWDPILKRHFDLFGFVDFLATGGGRTLALQVTSRANVSARRRKILSSPELGTVLESGWEVWILGFERDERGRPRAAVEERIGGRR